MKIRCLGLLALSCLSFDVFASATEQVAEAITSAQLPNTEASSPLIEQELELSDFPNMAPRPELAAKLGHVGGFIQYKPHDGDAPTGETEVWMAHSRKALYFVFICHDPQVGAISSHLSRRETIGNDDRVTILLDAFRDHREAIMIEANPAGVQADGIWNDPSGPMDLNYDIVWDSESRVFAGGWMTLIAIPFRSLRFPRNSSDWGLVLQRHIPRASEVSFWPRTTTQISGLLTQEGVLHGMTGMEHALGLQLNPYTIAQNHRTLVTTDEANPYFMRRDLAGSAGGEIKAILDDKLVFDATVNPDFSTVESDQPQFQVNQRYKVFFPELRPFFLENSNFFMTPINLVYTRNIVHPEFGARLSGKIGDTNLGLLAIDDRQPGEAVPPGDPLYGKRSMIAVARLSQNIHRQSRAGLLFTTEEFGGGWSRIGGLDFTASLDTHWLLQGQFVLNSTQEDQDSTDADTYTAGHAARLALTRSGHSFNMETYFKQFSKDFDSHLGFIPTTDLRAFDSHYSYQWYPNSRTVNSYGVETFQNLAWDQQGYRLWHNSNHVFFVMLPRSTKLMLFGGQNSDTLGPDDDETLTTHKNFTENFAGFVADSAPSPLINFHIKVQRGGNVNYNPATGRSSALLRQQLVQVQLGLQPLRQATVDNTVLFDRDFLAHGNTFVYEAQTYRTKINYQFTKAFSARVIAEYDSTLSNPAESSLQRKKQLSTQALLSWLPHPGTAIYLGYNNNLSNIDRSLCFKLANGRCDTDADDFPRSPNWLNDGRQFFVKVAYLYRF